MAPVLISAFALFAAATTPYWARPDIHCLGNVGPLSHLHARVAEPFTRHLEESVYKNTKVRRMVATAIANCNYKNVVDLGCGVGLSTPPHALGVDVSPVMLARAIALRDDASFARGNIETFGTWKQFDAAILSFVLHEAPREARLRILKNALRIAKLVVVTDIHPAYKPSPVMLLGEPFLVDFLEHIQDDVKSLAARVEHLDVVPAQVRAWAMVPEEKTWGTY